MSKKWNKSIVVLSVLVLFLFAGRAFAADGWNKVAEDVNKEQNTALQNVTKTDELVKMDKAALTKELANLKADNKVQQKKLDGLRKQFLDLRKSEAQHQQDLANEKDEIDAIEGSVRATAKDASSMSRDNPITAAFPEQTKVLDGILNSSKMPGMDAIKALADFYFQEMTEQGKIMRRTGKFIGPSGKTVTGDIIRIGPFCAYYKLPDGKVGFLTPSASGDLLIAVNGQIPGGDIGAIRNYFNKKSDIVPFDMSNGGFFAQLTRSESFSEWLHKGGIFMYCILIVAIAAALLSLERFFVLITKRRASDKVMAYIKDMADQGKWKEAHEYCSSQSRIPTCQMLDNAIEHVGHSQEVLENALQEAVLRQVPKLERFLPTLALFAAISPLLGLLGTVSGMIKTFEVITQVGTGNPSMMAGGISEALLTTYFGLTVAIPLMFVHHFLKSQVDRIINDMEEKGTAFAITLVKQGSK